MKNKHVLLGITGSIAAYKTPELVRMLRAKGAAVTCVLTANGARFVTPLTLQTVSAQKVYQEMFDASVWDVEHVSLAQKADAIVIAPASADAMARLAQGRAEDLLSCTVLAAKAPVLVCPAMNGNMWLHAATKENVAKLRQYGYAIVEPETGELACGDKGPGRLACLENIVTAIQKALKG